MPYDVFYRSTPDNPIHRRVPQPLVLKMSFMNGRKEPGPMWHPPPPTKMPERNMMDAPGLLITGTHGYCGKTVCAAGIVGALNNLGFRLQAIKPLAFSPLNAIRPPNIEQDYFNRLAIEMG